MYRVSSFLGRSSVKSRIVRGATLCAIVSLAVTIGFHPTLGQTADTVAVEPTSQPAPDTLTVTGITLRYKTEGAQTLPDLELARNRSVFLIRSGESYLGADATTPGSIQVPISEIGKPPYTSLDAGAVRAICQSVTSYVNDAGIYAVFTEPDPQQVTYDPDAKTVRYNQPEQTTLPLQVLVARVTKVRTIGAGQRVPMDRRIDNPMHQRIVRGSPIQPTGVGATDTDRIRVNQLDEYALSLNRFPGRRVDAAITAGEEEGDVWLDYVVTETKPWYVILQISNTGTDATNEWRERFAGILYQLFDRDDILAIDYNTAGFSDSHTLNLAYEGNLLDSNRLRWRVNGIYNQFTASDLALGGGGITDLDGSEAGVDLELVPTLAQWRETFLDGFVGGRVHNYRTDPDDDTVGDGEATYYGVFGGLRLTRLSDQSSTEAELRLGYEWSNADEVDIEQLGQLGADDSWLLLQGHINQSFYLDPFLFPDRFRPDNDEVASLVNELFFSARFQCSFGATLIPQRTEILGGFYTVRGYDESVVSGDDAVYGTIEYRHHFARSLTPAGMGAAATPLSQMFGPEFRDRPDRRKFGTTDWDLIFRAFVDAGWTGSNAIDGSNNTLVGTGIGIELLLKQNVGLRVDYGFALRDAGEVDAGDSRCHIVATFSY
jgi:hemolysin activation/secretion protein